LAEFVFDFLAFCSPVTTVDQIVEINSYKKPIESHILLRMNSNSGFIVIL